MICLKHRANGVALVLVLAFLTLLAGIALTYLARSGVDRQLSHGTFNDTRADLLARSALDVIVGDVKQEIANGSSASTVSGITIYTPTATANNANVIPQRSGNPSFAGGASNDPIPNLIRRSVNPDNIANPPGVPSRAAPINSTVSSSNGRSVTTARWNRHYLIPRVSGATTSETTPISAFVAPDWVLVSRNGPVFVNTWNTSFVTDSSSSNPNYVMGRYAYAVYNEGGLLDLNVSGFPAGTDSTMASHKGYAAFNDLTAPAVGLSSNAVDDLVGWRNYASAQPNGTFGNFTFNSASAGRYISAVLAATNGFISVQPGTYSTGSGPRSNQAFVNRQTLISYRGSAGIAWNPDVLQYFGTFSRELNIPSWGLSLVLRVTAPFSRRDGTQAQIGEPLLRRFPVSELAWIGPGGPVSPGTAATVRRDFGLVWNADHWDYYGAAGTSLASAIAPLKASTGTREPDFFELLAFARQAASPPISETLRIGASLIDQYDTDTATTRVAYLDSTSGTVMYAYGVETVPAPPPAPPPPSGAAVLDRAFQTVGEFGFAYRNATATLDLYTASTQDAAVLDLFGVNVGYMRAGIVDLNTRNSPALAPAISGAQRRFNPPANVSGPRSTRAAADLADTAYTNHALSRQDLPRLASALRTSEIGPSEDEREVIARCLGEVSQTRTWNLMIDVIAQSGRYPPTARGFANFVVEGEKRYWLHVAIDRFTGEVIDQQLEAVYE